MTRLTVSIVYCVRCNFLPRALWMANELLHTYPDFIEALELVPGSGGDFEIRVDGAVLFSRRTNGRYPEVREVKEAINRLLAEDEVATLRRHPAREGS